MGRPSLQLATTTRDEILNSLREALREALREKLLLLKAHVHPNGFARLCFCFETILLSNAVFDWLPL